MDGAADLLFRIWAGTSHIEEEKCKRVYSDILIVAIF